MPVQNFGGTAKSIIVFLKKACCQLPFSFLSPEWLLPFKTIKFQMFMVLMEFHSNTCYSFPLLYSIYCNISVDLCKIQISSKYMNLSIVSPVLSLTIVLMFLLVN